MVATATASTSTPANIDSKGNDDSHLSVCNQSTKSSQGRKLRQVLQKKQLDVLLQTYSSFIEEAEEIPAPTSEFSLIARKNSIEGNPNAIPMAEMIERTRNDASVGEERAPVGDIRRSRMRKSKSLIEDDESSAGTEDGRQQEPISMDENLKDAKANKDAARKSKKKSSVSKRKKKVDFSTRMMKANEALKTFGGRAIEKQLEVAADFQEATKEIRYQLKSGANVVFEELADQFDGIVENFFVGETETRDDSGIVPRDSSQSAPKSSHGCARILQIHGSDFESSDPNFHPRSHDETIQVMNKQVHDILEPVVLLADKAQISCAGVADDLSLPTGRKPAIVASTGSF